jgi:predicted AlkP superfamily phosphohydrolase/phosphomutase
LYISIPPPLFKLARQLPMNMKSKLSDSLTAGGIDWSRTRFIALPNDGLGYVRFNVRGRESQGIIDLGEELEGVVQEVSDELAQWVDVHTGMPIVAHVHRTRDLFAGPRLDDLPDLIVEWGEPLPTDLSRSPRVGLLSERAREHRAGGHKHEGFLVAKGPGIPAGVRSPNADLIDLAPTVFKLLDLEPPASFDGKPIRDILTLV